MAVSPEHRAELVAMLARAMGLTEKDKIKHKTKVDKTKVVTSDAKVVRDAVVRVSPADPNYASSDDGVVKVRRSDFVTIDMRMYEAQQAWRREDRRRRREIDPFGLGHWGPVDEDE